MKWYKWRPKYERIAKELGLDIDEDRHAGRVMADILDGDNLSRLRKKIDGEECLVFGAGPSLEKDLDRLEESGWLERLLITADGATSAVLNYRVPDVIVTDLDGNVEDQLEAWRRGSWIVIHAHSDNIDIFKEIVPMLDERVLGTIQVDKPGRLHNFGGFTDGDRAAFLAHELGASRIYLAGMDLGEEIGKFSGSTNPEEKVKKLRICRELLSWLVDETGAEIFNITSSGEAIPNVPQRNVD